MRKLILNPNKISFSNKDENIFLHDYFLNLIDKKTLNTINYSVISKEKFEIKSEVSHTRNNKKICNEILRDLFPILNELNKVNWSYETWNFFIGQWLNVFVAVIRNRIKLVKPLINSDIDYKEQLNIGKKTALLCSGVRHFTYSCGLTDWNEKLFSRILYILDTNNFDNNTNLLNSINNISQKNETIFDKFFYNLKINFLKLFERIICSKNDYLIYNSYISNKFKLFRVILKLGNIPFPYAFSFFDNKIVKEKIDISLRKQLRINYESKDLDIKILKFLLVELLPTIYLEGFKKQKELAEDSHLPKKVRKVFISQAYNENSFKFWLADKINKGVKLAHGQHGAGHNIYKEFFGDYFEKGISQKFFTWGSVGNDKETVTAGNYLLNDTKPKVSSNKRKILLVLPTVDIIKRTPQIFNLDSFSKDVLEYQIFVDNIKPDLWNQTSIKNHPQISRRELNYLNFIPFDKKIKVLKKNITFEKSILDQNLIIFNYLSTEFLKMLSLDKPCMLMLNKNFFSDLVIEEIKEDFYKLSEIGVFHTNGASLANQVNNNINNIDNWWNNEKSNKLKNEFCHKHSNPNFNIDIFVDQLVKL